MENELIEAKFDASRGDCFSNLVAQSLLIYYLVTAASHEPQDVEVLESINA